MENTMNVGVDSSAPKKGGVLKVIVALIVIVAVVVGGYKGYQSWKIKTDPEYKKTQDAKKAQDDLADVIAKVSKLMTLPVGDAPVLATVNDAKTLIAQQPFFAGSENGDKLLLYPQSKKAIIYSESKNIIINAGPIYTENQQQAQAPAPAPAKVVAPAPAKAVAPAKK